MGNVSYKCFIIGVTVKLINSDRDSKPLPDVHNKFVSPTVDEKQKISETFALVKNSII